MSGSVSEPQSTFTWQPATHGDNPALVPNLTSDRNGLKSSEKQLVSVPDPKLTPAQIAFSIARGKEVSGRYSAHS